MSDPLATPIERRKVYELVAERLVARIRDDELRAGDVLPPERELMQQFGVGRSSVREALRMLESRGLIHSRGNGAFVVAPVGNPLNQGLRALMQGNEGDLRQLFEVRRILEGEAAALAAARRTDEHLDRLSAAVDEMAGEVDTEDRFIGADIAFHMTIAEAAGNRLIVHLMHAIRDQMRSAFGTVYHIPGSATRSLVQHREIAAAVALRRPDEARRLMHEHIRRVEDEFIEATTRAGPTG